MGMNNRNSRAQLIVSSISVFLLVSFYIIAFYCLNKDLKSIFDEGFFFISFKPASTFTAFSQPLSLGREILKALFPDIAGWDILSLRRLTYGLKLSGLIVLLLAAFFFVRKRKEADSLNTLVSVISCILLLGLFIIPSIVVSSDDELVFGEMVAVALCLCAVCMSKGWVKVVLTSLVGCVSFFTMLCNTPGGGMLLLLSLFFLCFYSGFKWADAIETIAYAFLGVVLGILIMHFAVVSIPEVVGFVKGVLFQIMDESVGSSHSLTKLIVCILLNIRDLTIVVVSLFGITYVSRMAGQFFKKDWLAVVIGLFLFVLYYKWLVKPGVSFATIMTWLFLMAWLSKKETDRSDAGETVLLLFLFLLPFCLTIGSNSGFVFKSKIVIVPWGLLLFYMTLKVKERNPHLSNALYLFVFVLVMMDPGRYLVNCLTRESYHFEKEAPIARMHLSKPQYDFYNEVYDVLGDYGYVSRQDTVLGFCFNEMTLVAVDAVPYSNDQQPEEFLQHGKDHLPRPSFLILSSWDEKRLSARFNELGWKLKEDYDVYTLKSHTDPNSSYRNERSTVYCLKERKRSAPVICDSVGNE